MAIVIHAFIHSCCVYLLSTHYLLGAGDKEIRLLSKSFKFRGRIILTSVFIKHSLCGKNCSKCFSTYQSL